MELKRNKIRQDMISFAMYQHKVTKKELAFALDLSYPPKANPDFFDGVISFSFDATRSLVGENDFI